MRFGPVTCGVMTDVQLKHTPPGAHDPMSVKELAVNVKNAPGQLGQITTVLAAAGVNVRGVTASSAGKQGWVRLVVDNVTAGAEALENSGFAVEIGEAVAVILENRPGHLDAALRALNEEKINIDYIYTAHRHDSQKLAAVLGVQTPGKVEKLLGDLGLELLSE